MVPNNVMRFAGPMVFPEPRLFIAESVLFDNGCDNSDETPYAPLWSDDMSFTCTLKFVMKHRKGYLDFISGKATNAARRFLRSSRRWKEQNRRKKLKEGKQ